MIARRLLLSILPLVLLAACSATPEQKPRVPSMDEMLARMTEQSGKTCIDFSDIDSHQVLDENVIGVSMRRGEHYLITTTQHCQFRGGTSVTLVSDSWGMLCSGGGGTVGDFGRSCPVRRIYKFPSEKLAHAALLAAKSRREAAEEFPDQEP